MKPAKLWNTCGRKTQVDYILLNKKSKYSVHSCQAYNTFSSLRSDERVVTMKMKLILRKVKTGSRGRNYGWDILKDKEIGIFSL